MLEKKYLTGLRWLWIAILIIILDQYTKYWITGHLILNEPLIVLPTFNLTLAYNTGAAFSFLHAASGWQNWVFGGLAGIASVLIIYWLFTLSWRAYWLDIALCFILGGALGNAIDRLRYGYVIDFFDFHLGSWHFAIFNVADSAICIGAFMLMLHWLRER